MKNDILISEVDMNNEVEQILKDFETFDKKFIKYKEQDKEIINSLIRKGQIKSFIDSSLFNNFNDSWNYFIKGICQFELAVKITQFIKKFHDANNRAFTEKLDEINSFIKATESLSLEAALSNGKTFTDNHFEYVRLTNNFYKNKYNAHSESSNYVLYGCGNRQLFHNNAPEVYATNVLFKEWLESKLNKSDDINEKTFPNSQIDYALIFYYLENGNELARTKTKKEKINKYIEDKNLPYNYKGFKASLSKVKEALSKNNLFYLEKLNQCIAFLKDSNPLVIRVIQNDIDIITEEQ